MKRVLLILAFTFATSAVFTSCREEAGDVEEGVEEVGEGIEDAADDID